MGEKGHPRKFATEQEFLNKAYEYIEYCKENERMANIAGFSVYCKMNKDTYYAQKEYYSVAFKEVEAMLEDAALNHKATSMGIFYLKNKFGYVDKVETVNTNLNADKDDFETVEEAKEYLKKLNVKVD